MNPTDLISRNLRRRVRASYFMAGLNFALLLLPSMHKPHYRILVVSVLIVNLAACWGILRGVEPTRDHDEDLRLVAFAKKCVLWLGFSLLAALLVLLLLGRLHGQVTPFLMCGYGFLLVAGQVLQTSLHKRIDELLNEK